MKFSLLVCALFGCAAPLKAAPAKTAPQEISRPGCVAAGTSLDGVGRFYAQRSVAILRAALRGEVPTIRASVSPSAEFTTRRGDAWSGGRSKGVNAIIEWAHNLAPSHFEILQIYEGPVAVAERECRGNSTILFRTEKEGSAVSVTFEFVDGLLIRATGQEGELVEGTLQ